VALVAVLAARVITSLDEHPGKGTLPFLGYPTLTGGPMDPGRPFTFGLVYVQNPKVPIVIQAVSLEQPTDGLRVIGAYVLVPAENPCGGIGLVRSFPPERDPTACPAGESYRLHPLRGWVVRPGGAAEILLGLVVTRPGVFSAKGVNLAYSVEGKRSTVEYPDAVTVCAPRTEFDSHCALLPGSSS